MKKNLLVFMVFVIIMIAASNFGGCSTGQSPETARLAPNFELQNLENQTVSLGDLKGKPVLLNFWASWCGPCRMEMPFLQEIFVDPEYKEGGLVILAVNLGETASVAQGFMDNNGLSFMVLLDTKQEVGTLYNIQYIPTTYLIDKDGKIRKVKIGAFLNKAEITSLLGSVIEGD